MKTKTIVVAFALAFSASAFAVADCKEAAPCQLEPALAEVGKKVVLLPAHKSVYTLDEMKSAPIVTLDGAGQFRLAQVIGWCVALPECNTKLRAALNEDEGPWESVKTDILRVLNNPNHPEFIALQHLTWTKGEAK